MITIHTVDIASYIDALVGCFVDTPSVGQSIDSQVLSIAGWALGRASPVCSVEVGGMGRETLAQVPVDQARPDVEAAYPNTGSAAHCGFLVAVPLIGLPAEFTLQVNVVGEDGGRHHIASVCGRRTALDLPPATDPQPLMVTTLGRTGSSWLVQLLGSHPEILALDPFRVDARMATYWAEVCRALVNPASYSSPLGALQPDNDLWWLGRGGAVPPPDDIGDIQHWLATTHVTEVASFCRDRIQSFYRHAGALEGRGTHARFAVEKLNPTWVPDMVWELFPSAREIFLVRDFRDVLASVLDFNRRRGHEAFGRGDFGSDESYVRRKVRVDGESLLAAWRARRDRALLIRYEDLVLQPQETVARILAHLGMATDAASATTFIRTDLRVDESTAAHRTTTNAAASVGRWRHDLDAPLQRICDEVLGDVLLGFGYGTHDPAAA